MAFEVQPVVDSTGSPGLRRDPSSERALRIDPVFNTQDPLRRSDEDQSQPQSAAVTTSLAEPTPNTRGRRAD